MLLLSRVKDESLVIDLGGEIVKVRVNRISISANGKREVQLGVEAPRQYKVWRTEIYESMLENQRAVAAPGKQQALVLRAFVKDPRE